MIEPTSKETTFIIFSDDWGRHPSSCQEIAKIWLQRNCARLVWVNTIGTRPPRLDWITLRRGVEKISAWGFRRPQNEESGETSATPEVLHPFMWPWFRTSFDRKLNQALLCRALRPYISNSTSSQEGTESPGSPGSSIVVISTLPIVADLPEALPEVARWVYYCVDDWSLWPGMDSRALAEMEKKFVSKSDLIIAAGPALRERLLGMTPEVHLITHGVTLDMWRGTPIPSEGALARDWEPPVFAFWGLLDERLDIAWLERLSQDLEQGTIVLAGECVSPELQRRLGSIPRVRLTGCLPSAQLPELAHDADVLIMPYCKNEATRQIQPFKMMEYLASGKPAVVRDLLAAEQWRDALCVAESAEEFSRLAKLCAERGITPEERHARERLDAETWENKAVEFEKLIFER
ncbi:MAG: glycosyltransferase [Planctomycetia bacterium]|nr:glycosyltransferase [Planctomycetia bacterium]